MFTRVCHFSFDRYCNCPSSTRISPTLQNHYNGSVSICEYSYDVVRRFLLAYTAWIRTQTKPGLWRPNRMHEWLQSHDHKNKTNNRSGPLIYVQQSNIIFSVINSLTVLSHSTVLGPPLRSFPTTSAAHPPSLSHSLFSNPFYYLYWTIRPLPPSPPISPYPSSDYSANPYSHQMLPITQWNASIAIQCTTNYLSCW